MINKYGIILVVFVAIVGMACVLYTTYINAETAAYISNMDFGSTFRVEAKTNGELEFYDEETKIGWNERDGWYYVMETYDDIPDENKHLYSSDYKMVMRHLRHDMREYLWKEGRP